MEALCVEFWVSSNIIPLLQNSLDKNWPPYHSWQTAPVWKFLTCGKFWVTFWMTCWIQPANFKVVHKKRWVWSSKGSFIFTEHQRRDFKLDGCGGTGSTTLCSCPPCFFPWLLIEAKAVLLHTGSAAGLSEWAVKLTTSGRLSYSSVTQATRGEADTLPLPRTKKKKMFPNLSTEVWVSSHGWTSWINHTSMTESVYTQKAWRNNRVGSELLSY